MDDERWRLSGKVTRDSRKPVVEGKWTVFGGEVR
jgi:hypothetical protein